MAADFDDFNRRLIDDLRANGGRATQAPFQGIDLLVLTTRGARSGEPRESPLAYSRDGERLVIVASKAGAPTHPAWYHNLVAHPKVTVEVDGEQVPVRASQVEDEAEYERLYARHAELVPSFNEYREKTSRRIPVIVLERR